MRLTEREVAVAADIGGTTMRLGVLDSDYSDRKSLPPLDRSPSAALRDGPVDVLCDQITSVVPDGKRLAAAVIGLPSMFDAETRIVTSSPNIPELEGQDVRAAVAARLGIPVVVDRETVLMTTGEWTAGAALGHSAVLGVYIGTGIGGAMLFDGQPYRGASGSAVEIGHVPVGFSGAPCICGNTDCLEAYASGHVLSDAAAAAGLRIEKIFVDDGGSDIVDGYVRALGHAMAAVANTLDPEILIIGGGLTSRPAFPMQRIVACIKAHLRAPNLRENLVIKPASLGSQAIIPGAHHLLKRL